MSAQMWDAIMHQIVEEVGAYIKEGRLKLPLHVVITDNDDALVAEFEMGDSGKCTPLSPPLAVLPGTDALPFVLTVTDSTGKEMEATFSEDLVSKLQQRIS